MTKDLKDNYYHPIRDQMGMFLEVAGEINVGYQEHQDKILTTRVVIRAAVESVVVIIK